MNRAIRCNTVKRALPQPVLPLAFRFDEETRKALKALAAHHRLPQVRIIEMAIRQKARKLGLVKK